MASFSCVDEMRVCMSCQGHGSVKETDSCHIVRDATCDKCRGEGLIYTGTGNNPFEAKELKRLGDEKMRNCDYQGAVELYGKSDLLIEARANKVLALLRLKKFAEAAEEATAVIEKAQSKSLIQLKCLLRRALAHSAQNRRELALEDLGRVLEVQPGHPRALEEQAKLTSDPLEDCD